jgi:undecaprenyl phosphate N,N'-diacetylbacillosamine 1-phosphate transferase
MYDRFFKRIVDLCITFLTLLIALPVIFLLGLLIFLQDRRTPFFTQLRPGRTNRVFRVMKLRTMNTKRDSNGNLLADEFRLTGIGRFIRKTSLDELPQLFNVLLGHMSIVGPRPLLVQYLPLYTTEQKRRHLVKPGITGWAQVNGRNAISWEEKFKLDVWYVDNQSFWLDMKILWLTIRKVLVREGINQDGQATMEPFKGSES